MKKMVCVFITMSVIISSVLSQAVMAFEIPDFEGLASEAASGISGAVAEMTDAAGETADTVKKQLEDAGVTVKISAERLGNATVQKASELMEQVGNGADDAIDAVSEAADFVVDQAGHVVDLAAMGADYVSDGAMEVLESLKEYGSLLMKIAEDAFSEIDLSKSENWENARKIVYNAIKKVYDEGLIDPAIISEETIKIAAGIVFGALMYGYLYQNNEITLGEYVSRMSEVIIREGLPTGVGYLVKLLPINVPDADSMAKEVTYYLISVAYGDKSGEEIVKEAFSN